MSKIFAKVNGLHKIFNTAENNLGELVYDISKLKDDVLTNHSVNENTIFYIETDDVDHQLDYKGTYIYSHNELFSNYDNKGGQYIQTNIDVEHNTSELGYAFGKITPLDSNTNRLWNISYHIQAYSTNTDYNSEYDVCLYGYNDIILSYCTFNAVGAHSPYLNHVIVKEDNAIKVGLSFIADDIDRRISIIINDYRNCIFEQISEPNIVVEGLNVIRFDAATNGFIQKEIVEKVTVSTSTIDAKFPLMAIATSSVTSGNKYQAIYDTGIVINPNKHSVAEGSDTTASGVYSHAGGYYTIANTQQVTAIGRYNSTCSNGDLFVVGNGIDNNTRKTVFKVSDSTGTTSGGGNAIVTVTGRVNANEGFFQTSDKRQKNIISDLSLEKVYDLIDKCQTIIYTLKDDPENKEQIGMIAQEIQEFFPEVISEDKDGMLSLDYSRLTVIIFKVLKDLIKRINKIEQKLN